MSNRNQKISFDKFTNQVNDHDSTLIDVLQPATEFDYLGGRQIRTAEVTELGTVQVENWLNDNAYKQLCGRLGAPHQWLNSQRCPADLEQTVITRLQQDIDKTLLFRHRDDVCRAVLSDKYLVYNHLEFWQDVESCITDTGLAELKPQIWKPYVNDTLDAWILFEAVNADPDKDPEMYDGGGAGGLKPAIHIRNTEDGTGSVRIDSGMHRGYCENGVIFGWSKQGAMSAEHLGNSTEHMKVKVALAIADAAAQCQFGIEKFLEATEIRIKENVIDKVVAEWSKVYKMDVETSNLWQAALAPAKTWADIVMVTSDVAGTLQDRDMATTLEEASGAILIAGPKDVRWIER